MLCLEINVAQQPTSGEGGVVNKIGLKWTQLLFMSLKGFICGMFKIAKEEEANDELAIVFTAFRNILEIHETQWRWGSMDG